MLIQELEGRVKVNKTQAWKNVTESKSQISPSADQCFLHATWQLAQSVCINKDTRILWLSGRAQAPSSSSQFCLEWHQGGPKHMLVQQAFLFTSGDPDGPLIFKHAQHT